MVRKLYQKGASLTQYVIIIALVSVVLVPVFFMFGKTIVNSFNDFFLALKAGKNIQSQTNPSSGGTTPAVNEELATPGVTKPATASPDKPAKDCKNGICTIDYGDFVLTGIPENLQVHLQAAGASGTTEDIVSLLEQIIAQEDQIDSNINFNILKEIANNGHGIAKLEETLENDARAYLANPNDDAEYSFFKINMILDGGPGTNRNRIDDLVEDLEDICKNSNNPSDINILAIVKTLTNEIATLADKMSVIADDCGLVGYHADAIQQILKPNASLTTHLDSAIICSTGKNVDTGTYCK